LRTDPHNKSLWYEVDREFRRLEQVEIYWLALSHMGI
jgi:hypothetical protein